MTKKRIRKGDTFLEAALSGLPGQFSTLFLPRCSIEMGILADMVKDDKNKMLFDKVKEQCKILNTTLFDEIDSSSFIQNEIKGRVKQLKEFLMRAPRYRTNLSYDMAFEQDNLLLALGALIKKPPLGNVEIEQVFSLYANMNSLYESAKDIQKNFKKINNHYKKADRMDVNSLLSISEEFYKKYHQPDIMLIRHSIDHNASTPNIEKQTITFKLSKLGKKGEKIPLGIESMLLVEFFVFVMKCHSLIMTLRIIILTNHMMSSLFIHYGKSP